MRGIWGRRKVPTLGGKKTQSQFPTGKKCWSETPSYWWLARYVHFHRPHNGWYHAEHYVRSSGSLNIYGGSNISSLAWTRTVALVSLVCVFASILWWMTSSWSWCLVVKLSWFSHQVSWWPKQSWCALFKSSGQWLEQLRWPQLFFFLPHINPYKWMINPWHISRPAFPCLEYGIKPDTSRTLKMVSILKVPITALSKACNQTYEP